MEELIALLKLDSDPAKLAAAINALKATADVEKPKPEAQVAWAVLNDCFDAILDYCTMAQITQIGRTSQSFRTRVRSYLARRFNNLLKYWVAKPIVFRDLMRETNTVVSGSTALAFALGQDWGSKDLDLYTPFGTPCAKILKYLIKTEGYNLDLEREGEILEHEYFSPETAFHMRIVHKLKKTIYPNDDETAEPQVRRIDLIESSSASAVVPIFRFHSTAVMNWIGADYLFMTYPKLTMNMKSLVNETIRQPAEKEEIWINKYSARGFTFVRGIRALGEPCNAACPCIRRNTLDVGCLSAQFGDNEKAVQQPPEVQWEVLTGGAWKRCPNPLCFRGTAALKRRL